jgi:delta24-sterol reductase
MEEHRSTVVTLASEVTRFNASKIPFRIYHGSTLSTRQSSHQRDKVIDVSPLSHVLRFDKAEKTVLVEPNVSMDQLVVATLAEGLLPRVVMGACEPQTANEHGPDVR